MRLLLELVSGQERAGASSPGYVVGTRPVLIGRTPECDWRFEDEIVSRTHARVTFLSGVYFVEWLGTNDMSLETGGQRVSLAKGQPMPLQDGARLYLVDEYVLRVSKQDRDDLPVGPYGLSVPEPAQASGPGAVHGTGIGGAVTSGPDPLPGQGGRGGGIDRIIGNGVSREPVARKENSAGYSVLDNTVTIGGGAPALKTWPEESQQTSGGGSEAKWSPVKPDPPPSDPPDIVNSPPLPVPWEPSRHTERPRSGPAPQPEGSGGGGELAALLRGAGLDPSEFDLTVETARELGEVLRAVVEGTRSLLAVRGELKNQAKAKATQYKRQENNPLKMSADGQDALYKLLVPRDQVYLGPREAFEEAFAELREVQVALVEGQRAAVEALITGFDPGRIQREVDGEEKTALVKALAKARYWDAYVDKMHAAGRKPEDRFRKLFWDPFSRAFEDQLDALRRERRPSGKQGGRR